MGPSSFVRVHGLPSSKAGFKGSALVTEKIRFLTLIWVFRETEQKHNKLIIMTFCEAKTGLQGGHNKVFVTISGHYYNLLKQRHSCSFLEQAVQGGHRSVLEKQT